MRRELEETYVHKFDSPMCAYAYNITLEGGEDDSCGDVESPAGWFAIIGRRIIQEDSQGFVTLTKYATNDEARDVYSALERIYDEWCDDDDDDNDEWRRNNLAGTTSEEWTPFRDNYNAQTGNACEHCRVVYAAQHRHKGDAVEVGPARCAVCGVEVTAIAEAHAFYYADAHGDSLSYVPTLHDHHPADDANYPADTRDACGYCAGRGCKSCGFTGHDSRRVARVWIPGNLYARYDVDTGEVEKLTFVPNESDAGYFGPPTEVLEVSNVGVDAGDVESYAEVVAEMNTEDTAGPFWRGVQAALASDMSIGWEE